LRIRATSDLHLTQATAPYVFAALEQLRKDASKYGGVTVVCGDVFEQGVSANMPLWNRLRDLLFSWPGPIVLVPGNHDQYDEYRNALEGLHGGSSIVVSHPTPQLRIPRFGTIGGAIPYTHDFDSVFQYVLKDRSGAAPKLVFCHHGFKGAYLNDMYKCRRGGSVRSIPADTLVVSGHYHMPQVLGRVVYCGSPYQLTFSEEGQGKGWLLWKDASKSLIPIRKPFKGLGAPRHVTIHWDIGDGAPVKPDWLEDRDKVRVIVSASRADVPNMSATLEKAGIIAPVMYRPISTPTARSIDDFSGDVLGAVVSYMERNAAAAPTDMHAFAQREELWQDLS